MRVYMYIYSILLLPKARNGRYLVGRPASVCKLVPVLAAPELGGAVDGEVPGDADAGLPR